MLLPIFFSILASVMPGLSMDLSQDDIYKIERISWIEEFDDRQFWTQTAAQTSLTPMELISKHGYNGELHVVTTSDGYILQLHRIIGRANSTSNVQKPVAFVMHGLLCSSACWILSGPENGLAYILSDAGYDVWLGNARGNVYAQGHVIPEVSKKMYWDFSWHNIGTYDLPIMIDYILQITGREKIFYLGHSQGTTSFFVMASERPEYQDKIQAMFAMAPVAYCGRMDNPILQFIARFSGPLHTLLNLIGVYEFAPSGVIMKSFQKLVCAEDAITQPLCKNMLFLLAGFNEDQFNKTLLPLILEYTPAGSSTKQVMHYAQLIKTGFLTVTPGKFRQYDNGWLANLVKYHSFFPPEYKLGSIKVPVVLHYSTNDWLANANDVEKLERELGNPYAKLRVPHKKFNHLDFMWAKDVKELLYNKILSLMTHFQ